MPVFNPGAAFRTVHYARLAKPCELVSLNGLEEAYDKGQTGDFSLAERRLGGLGEDAGPEVRAWAMAIRAQRWHAEPGKGELPNVGAVAELANGSATQARPLGLACAEGARAAVLRHDLTALDEWVELLEKFSGDAVVDAWVAVYRAWRAVASGDAEDAARCVEIAGTTATRAGSAAAVIEAAVVKALSAELAGDLDKATASARRAVRMARVEDLPQWQYMASLVLARVRRLLGMPHLAGRILRPLLGVAPPQWRGWIAWEAAMAGAMQLVPEIDLDDVSDPRGEARALGAFLLTATGGQPAPFHEASKRLQESSIVWGSRQHDAKLALVAVDARLPLHESSEEFRAWYLGHTDAPPAAIKGLCIDVVSNPADPGPAAFVVARPDRTTRRIAGLGESVVQTDARIERVRGKAERGPMTLAATALAGKAGVAREDLFRAVYGFEYDPDVNRGLINVLVHRVRKLTDGLGKFELVNGHRYVLTLTKSVVIPDPRCEHGLEDVMLRALARLGAQTAQSAAAGVGVPLRTAQRALARLVENGALVTDQDPNDARLLRYLVEDTTFSEPTKWS